MAAIETTDDCWGSEDDGPRQVSGAGEEPVWLSDAVVGQKQLTGLVRISILRGKSSVLSTWWWHVLCQESSELFEFAAVLGCGSQSHVQQLEKLSGSWTCQSGEYINNTSILLKYIITENWISGANMSRWTRRQICGCWARMSHIGQCNQMGNLWSPLDRWLKCLAWRLRASYWLPICWSIARIPKRPACWPITIAMSCAATWWRAMSCRIFWINASNGNASPHSTMSYHIGMRHCPVCCHFRH